MASWNNNTGRPNWSGNGGVVVKAKNISVSTLTADEVITKNLYADFISTNYLQSRSISSVNGSIGFLSNLVLNAGIIGLGPGPTYLTANDGILYVNGDAVAFPSTLSTIADWSYFPAVANVNMGFSTIYNAKALSTNYVSSGGINAGSASFNSIFGSTITITNNFTGNKLFTNTISTNTISNDISRTNTIREVKTIILSRSITTQTWSPTKLYGALEIVFFQDNYYQAVIVNLNVNPADVIPEWVSGQSYVIGNCAFVTAVGCYVCVADNSVVTAPNNHPDSWFYIGGTNSPTNVWTEVFPEETSGYIAGNTKSYVQVGRISTMSLNTSSIKTNFILTNQINTSSINTNGISTSIIRANSISTNTLSASNITSVLLDTTKLGVDKITLSPDPLLPDLWVATQLYNVGDIVTNNANYYICIRSNIGAPPGGVIQNWFVKSWIVGECAFVVGVAAYICIVANSFSSPPNTNPGYWENIGVTNSTSPLWSSYTLPGLFSGSILGNNNSLVQVGFVSTISFNASSINAGTFNTSNIVSYNITNSNLLSNGGDAQFNTLTTGGNLTTNGNLNVNNSINFDADGNNNINGGTTQNGSPLGTQTRFYNSLNNFLNVNTNAVNIYGCGTGNEFIPPFRNYSVLNVGENEFAPATVVFNGLNPDPLDPLINATTALIVRGDTSLTGNTSFYPLNGSLTAYSAYGNAYVYGTFTTTGLFTSQGAALFEGIVNTLGDANVGGVATVTGIGTFLGGVAITGLLTAQNSEINFNNNVGGSAYTFTNWGGTVLKNGLTLTGDGVAQNNFTVGETLGVNGDVVVNGVIYGTVISGAENISTLNVSTLRAFNVSSITNTTQELFVSSIAGYSNRPIKFNNLINANNISTNHVDVVGSLSGVSPTDSGIFFSRSNADIPLGALGCETSNQFSIIGLDNTSIRSFNNLEIASAISNIRFVTPFGSTEISDGLDGGQLNVPNISSLLITTANLAVKPYSDEGNGGANFYQLNDTEIPRGVIGAVDDVFNIISVSTMSIRSFEGLAIESANQMAFVTPSTLTIDAYAINNIGGGIATSSIGAIYMEAERISTISLYASEVYTSYLGNPNTQEATPIVVNNDLDLRESNIINVNYLDVNSISTNLISTGSLFARSTFTSVIQPSLDAGAFSNIVRIQGNLSTQNLMVSTINRKLYPYTSTLNIPFSTFSITGNQAGTPILLYRNVEFLNQGFHRISQKAILSKNSGGNSQDIHANIFYTVGAFPSTPSITDGYSALPYVNDDSRSTFTTLMTEFYVSTPTTRSIYYYDSAAKNYTSRLYMGTLFDTFTPDLGNNPTRIPTIF